MHYWWNALEIRTFDSLIALPWKCGRPNLGRKLSLDIAYHCRCEDQAFRSGATILHSHWHRKWFVPRLKSTHMKLLRQLWSILSLSAFPKWHTDIAIATVNSEFTCENIFWNHLQFSIPLMLCVSRASWGRQVCKCIVHRWIYWVSIPLQWRFIYNSEKARKTARGSYLWIR